MRILYLSKNLENIKLQITKKIFLKALSKKKTSIFVYGPGYSYFDKNKKLKDIVNIYGPFSFIFIGHAWLHDGNNSEIDPWRTRIYRK